MKRRAIVARLGLVLVLVSVSESISLNNFDSTEAFYAPIGLESADNRPTMEVRCMAAQKQLENQRVPSLSPTLIDLDSVTAHPANPRLVPREDVIAAIEGQVKAAGRFDPSHAIIVRPLDSGYQIVSGHHRVDAARRAELKQIPAWVRDMDDDEAFMQLIWSNSQAELSLLERGVHALAPTEKGKHNGRSIATYAGLIATDERIVRTWIAAATVSSKTGHKPEFQDRTRHLAEIHHAPEHCWYVLVQRLIDEKWTVDRTIEAVKAVLAVKPPRGYERLFPLAWLQEVVARGKDPEHDVNRAKRAIERARADIREAAFEVEEHLAEFEDWLLEHPLDDAAITAKARDLTDRQRKRIAESEAKLAKLNRPMTLAEWKTLTPDEQQLVLAIKNPKAKFKRDNNSMEWAKWSWDPVTGCQYNCPYCSARDTAERYYTQKFEPSIVPEALTAPLNMEVSKGAEQDLGLKNVLTCPRADLFGDWVPREWIDRILEICRQEPQWNFLILTKFPECLVEFEFPDNVWVGTTVDCQARVANAELAMREVNARMKWLSIEPLIEPIEIDFSIFEWVVIGGASASTQTPEWRPPRAWVHDLTARAMKAGCAVYHQVNLHLERLRQYPGSQDREPQVAPPEFHYLKQTRNDLAAIREASAGPGGLGKNEG